MVLTTLSKSSRFDTNMKAPDCRLKTYSRMRGCKWPQGNWQQTSAHLVARGTRSTMSHLLLSLIELLTTSMKFFGCNFLPVNVRKWTDKQACVNRQKKTWTNLKVWIRAVCSLQRSFFSCWKSNDDPAGPRVTRSFETGWHRRNSARSSWQNQALVWPFFWNWSNS